MILAAGPGYSGLVGGIAEMLENARRAAARTVNALMTATYWEIGRRIVEFEQGGKERARYGEELLVRLAADLTSQFGRGFSRRNLQGMRLFYLSFSRKKIWQTLSAQSRETQIAQTASAKFDGPTPRSAPSSDFLLSDLAIAFPLPWSHYVRLLAVKSTAARDFYHAEALRGGWSVRQLDRQIASQFYERTALSKNKTAMLRKGNAGQPGDALSADEEIRDPLILEFLGLKDEYSETDLEESLL